MKKLFALMLAMGLLMAVSVIAQEAAKPAPDMGKAATVNGWVVDDKCGAKAAHDGNMECTKKCLAAGAKLVVVTDGDQKVLKVENPDALKDHEGHHVAVTGHV